MIPKDCARQLKVLGDELRLAAMNLLRSGPKSVSEINEVLRVEQSLLSHHLKILRDSGLVRTKRAGRAIIYEITPSILMKGGRSLDLGCCHLDFSMFKTTR